MKKFAIGLILASAAFTGTAQAQNFDGLRIEGRVGADRQRFEIDQEDAEDFFGDDSEAVFRENDMFYGVGVGYDRQEGPVVIGFDLAVDFPQAEISREFGGNDETGVFAGVEIENDIEASFRMGFPVTPNFLIYGRAGASFAEFTASSVDTNDDDESGEQSDRAFGYRLGAGVEFAAAQGFYGKAEYRYTDYGDIDVVTDFFDLETQQASLSRHQFMGAIGFRF